MQNRDLRSPTVSVHGLCGARKPHTRRKTRRLRRQMAYASSSSLLWRGEGSGWKYVVANLSQTGRVDTWECDVYLTFLYLVTRTYHKHYCDCSSAVLEYHVQSKPRTQSKSRIRCSSCWYAKLDIYNVLLGLAMIIKSCLRSSLFCTGVLLFYCHIVCLASWFGHGAVDVPS
jgi:hypothetical protein